MIINMNGGAARKTTGFIVVTYPEGSICTITMNDQTITAKDTTGYYVFEIKQLGIWTVSCTNGTDSKSTTVSITINGQSESVTLMYKAYYFNQGDQCTDITGGWRIGDTVGGAVAGTVTIGDTLYCKAESAYYMSAAVTTNAIDLTEINTLYCYTPSGTVSNGGYVGYFFVANSPSMNGVGTSYVPAQVQLRSASTTYTIDVSSLTGSYYLGVGAQGGNSGNCSVDASLIYGE